MTEQALYEEELFEAKAANTFNDLLRGSREVLKVAEPGGLSNGIKVKDFKSVLMAGTKSMQCTSECQSPDSDEAYRTAITFYDVQPDAVIRASQNPCRVTCSCRSYYFWFAYPNFLGDAHLGPKPKEYKPVANPKRAPGPPKNPNNIPGACKHLIAMVQAMIQNGVIEK